jgi:hypothetical protein
MGRTRIRWPNVGRVGAGIAVGAVAIFAAAEVLEPPPREPLPADVGLATGTTGAAAYEPAPAETDRPPPPGPRRPPRPPPERAREGVEPPDPSEPERDRERPDRGRQPAEVPVTQVETAPPTSPPAASPVPSPPPATVEEDPLPGDVKAEFGFEPRR